MIYQHGQLYADLSAIICYALILSALRIIEHSGVPPSVALQYY